MAGFDAPKAEPKPDATAVMGQFFGNQAEGTASGKETKEKTPEAQIQAEWDKIQPKYQGKMNNVKGEDEEAANTIARDANNELQQLVSADPQLANKIKEGKMVELTNHLTFKFKVMGHTGNLYFFLRAEKMEGKLKTYYVTSRSGDEGPPD